MSTEVMVDRHYGTQVFSEADLPVRQVMDAAMRQSPEIASIIRWTMSTQGIGPEARYGGLWERDRFVTPPIIYDQMRVAHDAVENDDVVSGVLESTEAIAFSKVDFSSEDEDEEDVWGQIAEDIDLDSRMREMWREEFTVSQFYVAVWWGRRSYRVRGRSDKGVQRKRTFDNLKVPTGITLLDPLKVVPVGNLMFNQERLCYIADRTEVDMLDAAVLGDPQADEMSRQLIVEKYNPTDMERRNLANLGVAYPDWLYVLNPQNVWRYTATRPQYQRFAAVRMKSVFELLDLKHQLRQSDRATLIGATNFIVLIRKGTDKLPAHPSEITNLQGQVRMIARVPVIVGDHRLTVEIVTPKTDNTLSEDKHGTADARISARLYHMFMTSHVGAGAMRDDSVKVAKVVARGMESRRYLMRRAFERNIVEPTVDANDAFTTTPAIRFHPHRIQLDFDPALVNLLLELYQQGDVSRDTMLSEADLDQRDEAIRKQREKAHYDDIFQTTIPFSGPQAHSGGGAGPSSAGPSADKTAGTQPSSRQAGRSRGGTRGGGGAAPGTGQGQSPRGRKPKTT